MINMKNNYFKILAAIGLSAMLFVYGVGVGHYNWPPFDLMQKMRATINLQSNTVQDTTKEEYQGEWELLQHAFPDTVNETSLYYPPITSLAEIREANERIFIPREGFENAYQLLEVLDATQLIRQEGEEPIMRVRFRYLEDTYEAFSYGIKPESCHENHIGSLIIPGSGINQSLGIATEDPDNYHYGIMMALNDLNGYKYVFIKPNEDFLAFGNGYGKKLAGTFIWNWHINSGGSYSVSYLVQSMAFQKWMESCFDNTLVAGLSQGGAATLLIAIQSEPNIAIIASGHSLINLTQWSGHDQILAVPGYSLLFNAEILRKKLNTQFGSWFFSFGLNETGSYRIEAEERITKNKIDSLQNVNVVIHDGGHEFPVQEIKEWLQEEVDLK